MYSDDTSMDAKTQFFGSGVSLMRIINSVVSLMMFLISGWSQMSTNCDSFRCLWGIFQSSHVKKEAQHGRRAEQERERRGERQLRC